MLLSCPTATLRPAVVEMIKPTPEQVKQARRAAGLTQEQAGAVVHRVGRKRWYEWEAGQRQMAADTWELFLLKTGQAELVPCTPPRERSGQ